MMKRWVLFPLFTVVFLDTFGGFFVTPLVNSLFYQAHTGIVSGHVSMNLRNFYLGLSNSIYFIMIFIFSPVMGAISDHIGRKRTLLLCLAGSFIGYMLTIFAIFEHNVWLFIIGRLIDGASGGSMPVAQAAIIDVSDAKSKAVNMGYLTLALSLGIMLGPICGGVLSDARLSHFFSIQMPFYVASLLTLGNWIFLLKMYRESWTPPTAKAWHLFDSFKQYVTIPANKPLMLALFVYLLTQLGWGAFVQFMPVILSHDFGFTSSALGLYVGLMGVGCTIALGILIKPLLRHFKPLHVAFAALLMMGLSLVLFALTSRVGLLWVLILPMSIGIALSYSLLCTMISDCVLPEQQGWIMGVTSSMGSLAFGIATFGDGLIADLGLSMPIYVAIVCIGFALIAKPFMRHSVVPTQ